MEEEKPKEEEKKDDGAQVLVDNANAVATRMEEANKRQAELIEQQKLLDTERARITAEKALGGKTEAGSAPEEPKEETAKEYKDRIMAGEMNEQN